MMKKLIFVIIALTLVLCGCAKEEVEYINKTQGRILECNDHNYVLIYENSPIQLNIDESDDMTGYNDGDLVEVWHDMILTTYPGQTKVHKITLIEEGSMADIPEDVAKELCDLEWIDYEDMVERYTAAGYIIDCETTENYTMCEYSYCRMGVELPDGWLSEVNKSENECSIKFRPEAKMNGWVVLQCTNTPFLVCGTGLSTKNSIIGGYEASVAYYDGGDQFSFIRFDVPGEYIVRNVENSSWFKQYEDEINSILDTIILSGAKLTDADVRSMVEEIVPEYENLYTWFNSFDGTWTVDVYIDSVRYQIKYDNEGQVLSELAPMKY